MGKNNQSISIFQNNPNTWCYGMDFSYMLSIMTDLLRGVIKDFSISSFFQSNSDYIIKLQYFPFSLSKIRDFAVGGPLGLGKRGYSNYTVHGIIEKSINNVPFYNTVWFTIYQLTPTSYLDYAPYTKYTLSIPFFGKIDINPEFLYKGNIRAYLTVDIASGMGTVTIKNEFTENGVNKSYMIDVISKKLSIDIPIGKTNEEEQRRNNVLQLISSVGSAIGLYVGVASGNPLITAGSVGMLSKNVTTALSNNIDKLTSYNGGNGDKSLLGIDREIYMIKETVKNVNNISLALKGKPLKKNKLLSTVTGYTEIGEIHFNASNVEITDDELTELIDLLHSGVIL